MKFTTKITFIFNIKYCKQIEKDAIYNLKKQNYVNLLLTSSLETGKFLEFLNNYHSSIKLTSKINPDKFLDNLPQKGIKTTQN